VILIFFFQLPGIDSFEKAWNESIEFTIADIPVQILTLKQLIATKSAINSLNPRKQSVLEYLRQLLALKEKSK
jgi:hypothetical protein